jgi:hypothetical protein
MTTGGVARQRNDVIAMLFEPRRVETAHRHAERFQRAKLQLLPLAITMFGADDQPTVRASRTRTCEHPGGADMAPVKGVYGFRIKPGRFEEWRSMSREGEKLCTRLGSGQVRSMLPAAAGPETTVCYSTIDFTGGEAWGKFQDAVGREVEAQVFTERMFGHLDSPAELIFSGLITEVPLDSVSGTTMQNGPVLETFITRPRPGRYLDSIAFGNDIAPLVMKEGARSVHLYVTGPAGTQSGTHAFTIEHADFASLGRMQDAGTKPEWVDVMARALAADAPFDMVQHTVMTEVLLH